MTVAAGVRAAPTADEIYTAMRAGYDDLIDLVVTDAFQALIQELYALPEPERFAFVNDVILDPGELARRGVVIPDGILVQRSTFGDRRPTLFCVKKYIPEELQTHWQNVNITFDNSFDDTTVPRDERAWRPPLPVDLQQARDAGLLDAEALSRLEEI